MRFSKYLLILAAAFFISCNNRDSKPEDFDVFWKKTVDEQGTTIVSEKIKDSIVDDKKWSLYKLKSYKDITIFAWVSEPVATGKFPIKIRFSGFGERELKKDSIPHPWFLKRKNSINMIVDIRGQGLSQEQIKFKNFLTNGLDDKENYIYRGAYMDAVKSIDFIAQNPKSNGNIIVSGGSQGGTLAIVAAALNPKVTMCIVGFPFFTDFKNYDKRKWPMKLLIHYAKRNDIDLVDLNQTLSYFDIINFSEKVNVPIFIRTQETDPITPLLGCKNFFNKLKVDQKQLYIEECEGHGCSKKSKKANELERAFIKSNMLAN